MRYEVIGESIKSAISIRIGDMFKVASTNNGQVVYTYPYRYKENVTNQRYPNFHIIQVNSSVTPRETLTDRLENKDLERVQLDYLMNIQYRVAENQETVSTLRQQLDAVGLKLLAEFKYINLELPVYAKNCRYEIVDGVLQFFCNFTIYATLNTQNDALQGELDINEEVMGHLVVNQNEEVIEENNEEVEENND